jgi:2-polyprenyl-6-methoxyphenol hydroxylase-like FAD-dependent oxidoreductase
LSKDQGTMADVIIIGGGLAGASVARVLGRQNLRVSLVDRRSTYPDCFKAEKLEPDQIDLLHDLDMFDLLSERASRIHEVVCVSNNFVFSVRKLEQLGILYGDMVRAVRQSIPSKVQFRQAHVKSISTNSEMQRVILDDGDVLTSRLVILACGITNGKGLASSLGLRREMVAKDFSVAFGFDLERRDGRPFPFDAVTCYPSIYSCLFLPLTRSTIRSALRTNPSIFFRPNFCSNGVAYLTLFKTPNAMRANLFVFRSLSDKWVRAFLADPHARLDQCFPGLPAFLGGYNIVGNKVQTAGIDLYRMQGHRQPGLVIIGDALQSVCPATGTGLTKVLTDVDVLCNDCLPAWLATPGMGVEKIDCFYENQRKQTVDAHSLHIALHSRRAFTVSSLWQRILAACQDQPTSIWHKLIMKATS